MQRLPPPSVGLRGAAAVDVPPGVPMRTGGHRGILSRAQDGAASGRRELPEKEITPEPGDGVLPLPAW